MVFSENGIIAKAREAAEKTNQAVINEQEQMNEVGTIIDNMLNGIGDKMEKEPLRKISKVKKIKENIRNNSNSVSCDYCSIINISRNNNKFGV